MNPPRGGPEAIRRELREGVSQINLLEPSQYAEGVDAFNAFRKCTQRAASTQEAPLDQLLDDLEPKDKVLRFLIGFHEAKKIYRKQIAAVVTTLLQCPSWRKALEEDAELLGTLPSELSALTESPTSKPRTSEVSEPVFFHSYPQAANNSKDRPKPPVEPAQPVDQSPEQPAQRLALTMPSIGEEPADQPPELSAEELFADDAPLEAAAARPAGGEESADQPPEQPGQQPVADDVPPESAVERPARGEEPVRQPPEQPAQQSVADDGSSVAADWPSLPPVEPPSPVDPPPEPPAQQPEQRVAEDAPSEAAAAHPAQGVELPQQPPGSQEAPAASATRDVDPPERTALPSESPTVNGDEDGPPMDGTAGSIKDVLKSGWLRRRWKQNENEWAWHWAVLMPAMLQFYSDVDGQLHGGEISLGKKTFLEVHNEPCAAPQGDEVLFVFSLSGGGYECDALEFCYLATESRESLDAWTEAIQGSITGGEPAVRGNSWTNSCCSVS